MGDYLPKIPVIVTYFVTAIVKVLQVIPYFLPDARYGGPIEVVLGLSRALLQKGHEVVVVTTTAEGQTESTPIWTTEVSGYLRGLTVCYVRRLRWERAFSLVPYVGQTVGFFFAPELKRFLLQKGLDFDLFHLHEIFCYPALAAAKIATKHDIPYVVHLHSMLEPSKFARRRLKKTIYMNVFGKKLLNEANGIIALTNVESEDLNDLDLVAPVQVIPNGTSLRSIDKDGQDDFWDLGQSQVILFLGRLHPVKGIDLLLAAVGRVTDNHPDTTLVIAGPDELGLRKQLSQQVKSLNLSNSVRFTGMVTGENKQRLIKRADIFALTSYSEGFSMAILEALSYGKPVVITDACHFDDVSTYRAGLVSPCDVDAIARNLDALLSDSDLRIEMGNNARKLIREKYTWEIVADRTERFYEDILNGG